jgi:hypothetical protein
METAYDARQVVGIDLHRRRSVLVRMAKDGRRLGTVRITNSPEELHRVIARAGKSPKVVLEATYGRYWAADTLAAAGAEVRLFDCGRRLALAGCRAYLTRAVSCTTRR